MAENTVPSTVEKDQTPATREDSRFLVPPVDIYETESTLVVIADLPGVDKDDLNIHVEDDILTIDANAHDGLPGESLRDEFRLMRFHRQFTLSDQVDQEKIAAGLDHGVLTITLPKAEAAKPRQIPVSVG